MTYHQQWNWRRRSKKKKRKVDLTQGFFAENRGYVVHFNDNGFMQINAGSGSLKKKKKKKKFNPKVVLHYIYYYKYIYISKDDESIFEPLVLEDLDENHRKCMVCLEEFSEEDKKEKKIIKLCVCKSHGFHKECIAPWVQLKNFCPYCRTQIDTKTKNKKKKMFSQTIIIIIMFCFAILKEVAKNLNERNKNVRCKSTIKFLFLVNLKRIRAFSNFHRSDPIYFSRKQKNCFILFFCKYREIVLFTSFIIYFLDSQTVNCT
ncbi:hypothetical protein RFI_16461 [Reticulomyxa filosa]|uniref:RING-type domain-containing protein n=1 Tax=Reticulomyxa filosa TaxID=46433 RepID=X6N620_RETFI|nr:hypothetical protein RFI_16461 [Reticulomyxa filosa]|eukprot:ETO20757.1 hypothetical protein RFI_16461 [Reticulomyxa filosa]